MEKGGRSESVEATGLRCRELSPFSFIKSRLLVAVISAPLPSLISRSTRLLGCSVRPAARQAGRQDNKYCDATLCVCFLWKKKQKQKKTPTTTKKTKVIKEPDAKCIYLFIHSVPSPSSRLQRGEKKAVREAEGGVTGQKKIKIITRGGEGSWRLNTHSFTWHSSLSSLHTHTASALRSSRCVLCVLAHQSKSKDKAQKKWTQRGKK